MTKSAVLGVGIGLLCATTLRAEPSRRTDLFINDLARKNACVCRDGSAFDGMAGILDFALVADPNPSHVGNNVIKVGCFVASYANTNFDNLSGTECAGSFDILNK